MALPFYNWSRTAASNASADATINWAEGQAPSSVNDSARAMMASTAAFRDDIAGAIVTGGTSSAYTVTSFQVFDTLAHLNGKTIAFTPHVTNAEAPTLSVDGLTSQPILRGTNLGIYAGTLVGGTPYTVTYNSSTGAFYLNSFFGNPWNVPLAAGMDYWGSSAPNSQFAFPIGQAISRSIYAELFSLVGTTYGVGDNSTTFNLPDKTGRISAMKEAAGTRLTTAGGGVDGGTLGAVGGAQNGTIALANFPNISLTTNITESPHHHAISGLGVVAVNNGTGASQGNLVTTSGGTPLSKNTDDASTGITASTPLGGSGTAFKVTQPTIVCNYIMRIL